VHVRTINGRRKVDTQLNQMLIQIATTTLLRSNGLDGFLRLRPLSLVRWDQRPFVRASAPTLNSETDTLPKIVVFAFLFMVSQGRFRCTKALSKGTYHQITRARSSEMLKEVSFLVWFFFSVFFFGTSSDRLPELGTSEYMYTKTKD
jgi:hypothetical protein